MNPKQSPTEIPIANRVFYGMTDIPPVGDNEFWNALKNPAVKGVCNILLLDVVGAHDPAKLTNEQCRTQLAKAFMIAKLLMSPDSLQSELRAAEPIPQATI